MLQRVQIADPQPGAGSLSPSALRRNAAAGRHRHGARHQSEAADPGRADHRPRRHGGSGGARPHRAAARRDSPPRSCSSATISPSSRACATASACSMPARWWRRATTRELFNDPRHPYTVGLLRCLPRRGRRKDHGRLDTIPGFLPAPGTVIARLRLRRALRAGRRSLPRGGAAADRSRRPASQPLPLPRPGPGPAAGHASDLAIPIEIDRSHRRHPEQRPILPRPSWQRDRIGARAGDVSVDLWPGETLGLVGESGSGKTTLRPLLLGLTRPIRDSRDRARRQALAGHARPSAAQAQVKALQIVFQNPDSALNRSHPVRRLIGRAAGQAGGRARGAAQGAPARR